MPTTASAIPARLLTFAAASGDRSLTLRSAALDLGEALAPLRFFIGPWMGPPPALDVDLGQLAGRWEDLEENVRSVALAFEAADQQGLLPPGLRRPLAWIIDNFEDIGLVVKLGQPLRTFLTGKKPRAVGGRLIPAVSLGLTAADVVEDFGAVLGQGNPFRAFQERGTNYMADVSEVQFDLALGLFTARPNPITAALALGAGVNWANWKTFDERRRAAARVVGTIDRAQDRGRDYARDAVLGLIGMARGTVGGPGRRNPSLLPPWTEPILDAAADAVEKSDEVADDLVDAVREGTKSAAEVLGWPVEEGLDAAEDVTDAATEGAEGVAEEGAEAAGEIADAADEGPGEVAEEVVEGAGEVAEEGAEAVGGVVTEIGTEIGERVPIFG